ncbi:T9SS type B sorting domain-containing protein [Nonlabens marinus]|uniref:PKD domain-containing protein n=1 Tax=Nonlabens marinus S1-08 TaxID=1454201 RepID=W8W0N2_9FLAO|nr:T9SS type B sorting domain-containing protein [Nonlabens marinus]BAO56621.1 hypothetical protein NMS_2612 [Nonlabens marinus S1-08]
MIKTGYVLFVLLFCASQLSYGQLEAANWYFGFNAGLRFDPDTGAVTPLTDSAMSTNEGCATISDSDGNLLFYTDGSTVYNRNNIVMQNGSGLRGNASSTQSAIIIPKPQDSNIYYIFTVDTGVSGGGSDAGLNYYEVDMTADGGLGAVVTDITNPTNLLPFCSEKITAINHETRDEIIVVAYANSAGFSLPYDTFYSFTIDASGVNTTPVASIQPNSVDDRRGNLKVSPDGKYLVSCNSTSSSYIYDFDQSTGAVTNERLLPLPFPNFAGYGVEFSPNSSLLYILATNAGGGGPSGHSSGLYQFDLDARDVTSTGIVIDSRQGYRGSLQLGIDGKIYRAQAESFFDGSSFLGRINNPDIRGAGANYQHNAVELAGKMSAQGLPPFIQSFFAVINIENVCSGDTTLFSFETDTTPDSVLWDFGDGTTSTELSSSHVYTSAGIYEISLTLEFGGATRKYFKQVEIFDSPVANNASDIIACDDNLDGRETFDLTATSAEILGTQDAQTFPITYYLNQEDADMAQNKITLPFTSDVPQLAIYARIDNTFNSDCYDTTSFLVNIYDQPVANQVENLEQCDDNFDGIETFQLTSQNAGILQGQNPSQFTISYHLNATDAAGDLNPLPTSYRNTTTFQQTVFARIENNAETNCAAVTSFDLVVQAKPVAINFDAFQCDEDGIPDSRTNFNLSSFNSSVSNNAAGVTVAYYLNQNDADNERNPLNDRDYVNVTPLQTIVARVTDTNTGCFNTSTVTLSVSASDAQDTSLELCDDDGVQDGFRIFSLDNANNAVLANAPSDVTVSYYASTSDALAERNSLPLQFTNTVINRQVIYARAESPDGNCYGISKVELIVNELPQVEPTAYFEYCGNDPQALIIDAGPLSGSTTDYTYEWSTGATTYAIDVRDGGLYTVVVTNNSGCSGSREITVVISEPATINSIDVINANGERFGSATAVVSGLGDYEFRIDPNASYQESPVFKDLPPGFYVLEVNDRNGCGTVFQKFSIVGYPRFFTPNGDGFNDFWQLNGVNNIFEPDATIFIFDRFGKLLKQLSPSSQGWDGTFNGEPLPASGYWFKATLTDGTEFSSHFTLKR